MTVDMKAPFGWGDAPSYSRLREGVVHAIKWQTQNRYMQIEGFAEPAAPAIEQTPLQITPKAA
jgi:hypothetical protein